MGRPKGEDRPDPRFEPWLNEALKDDSFDQLEANPLYNLDLWVRFDFARYFAEYDDPQVCYRRPYSHGDVRTIMVMRCFALYRAESPTPVIEEIGERIGRLLGGETPAFALPTPWQPSPTLAEIMPRSMLDLVHLGTAVLKLLREDDTLTIGKAQERVSEETGKDLRTVERAWKFVRDELRIPPGKRPAKNL